MHLRYAASLLALVLVVSPIAPAQAQAATGTISGVVTDDRQQPLVGADVTASGRMTVRGTTGVGGAFALTVAPGLYRLDVTKSGFQRATAADITVLAGSESKETVQLQAASFSSLRTIGHVSAGGSSSINTSTSSVATVSGSAFIRQGQLSVNQVLNQIPGVVIGSGAGFGQNDGLVNGASPLTTGIPQIRGGLPYETESLIDGHPIAIGQYGTFNTSFINPYMLQDVEIVKGPGASPPNINDAIGGTVNFRTLEPTSRPQQSFDYGIDQFGGMNGNLRATGTLASGHWSYALDYATRGTQGQDRAFSEFLPVSHVPGPIINGTPACGNPATLAQCNASIGPPLAGKNYQFLGASTLQYPMTLCCVTVPLGSNQRNELGKLRYSFTPSTALTLTYLGSQTRGYAAGAQLYGSPVYVFGPAAGYTGPFAGQSIPFPLTAAANGQVQNNDNLFQAEFRTAIARTTLLARAYSASVSTFSGGPGQGPTPGFETFSGLLYGSAPLGNSTSPTFFNGIPATLTYTDSYYATRNFDKLSGFTIEDDIPIRDNLISVAYDEVTTKSRAYSVSSSGVFDANTVPHGSGQKFWTAMVRGQFQLIPQLQATLSDHFVSYTNHYTEDGGASFIDTTHGTQIPRLALQYRPTNALSVRAATGFSIAPPYINLLTNSLQPVPNSFPPKYFTITANSGGVLPETAFGFDFGFDQRLGRSDIVSFDAYQTTLRNQFLLSTAQTGTFTPPPGYPFPGTFPLFTTRTENLGHSRYEGLELTVHRDPTVGFGYRAQGSLLRAYPYDLSPSFYSSAAGPNTTNLGVIPNVNFQASGFQYNSLGNARIPYSQGYAELNHRSINGAYFLLGTTYYGPNNSYNLPPFAIVNASFQQPLTNHASLLLSVVNVTNAYPRLYYDIFGGIPTPLINGQLGSTSSNTIGPPTASLTFHADL